ncbi:rho GTPase-activating protein 36 [Ara ararauna]
MSRRARWVPVLQHVGCREEVGFGQATLASKSCPVGAGSAISCGPGSCLVEKQELGPAERWLHTEKSMLQMGVLDGEEANGILLQVPNLLCLQRELWDGSRHLLELWEPTFSSPLSSLGSAAAAPPGSSPPAGTRSIPLHAVGLLLGNPSLEAEKEPTVLLLLHRSRILPDPALTIPSQAGLCLWICPSCDGHLQRETFIPALLPGQSMDMQPVPLHSLSELERASLQEIALYQLQEKLLLGDLSLAKVGLKGSKTIRQKLESFSKEKKDCSPQTFGIPLSQVIANDRAHRQLQEVVRSSRRLCLEVEATVRMFQAQRHQRMGRSPVPCGALPEEPLPPTLPSSESWRQRRSAMSVDSITDLSDNTSQLLEALQLSQPHELGPQRSLGKKTTLSLNPITWQVPRIVDRCCKHIEMHGLHTVGIFRVGSSKKRVQQLREEFDRGVDVFLDEHQSVHDVAALLKEFLRDMPDPLIPRELYSAFLSTASMAGPAQLGALQLLLFLLPPAHSDTLLRLLRLLAEVARHARGSRRPDGQEIPGNKMTVSNLATIFGPNVLRKERPGEKDAAAVSYEDSTAIILVLQRLIEHHQTLFMVSPGAQRHILRRLFQTDPDVAEYLLRRRPRAAPSAESEDSREEHALSLLPGRTRTLENSSVSSELYSSVSFLNLDVGI